MSSVVDFFFSTNFFLFFFRSFQEEKGGNGGIVDGRKIFFFSSLFLRFRQLEFSFFFFAAIPFCSFHGKWSTCGGVSVRCSTDYVGKWKQQKKTVPPKKNNPTVFYSLKKKEMSFFLLKSVSEPIEIRSSIVKRVFIIS